MMTLKEILDRCFERQKVRTFYAPILRKNVLDADFPNEKFKLEKSYFKLRLAEMHLRNSAELFRDFVPFCVVLAEYFYDGERQSIPFVIGNELLVNADEFSLKGETIDHLRTGLGGMVPLMQDELGLFAGLFRTAVSDFSETLFGIVGDIAQAGDVSQLSSYLPVAKVLRGGIYRIFGLKEVEFRFGKRDVFQVRAGAGQRFQSGYLAFINAPEDDVKSAELWIKGGGLWVGANEKAIRRYRDHDYCLLVIEHHSARKQYTDLPFHQLWQVTQDMIWNDQVERAELFGMPALGLSVVKSPDLIPDEQTDALNVYHMNFEAEVKRWQEFKGFGGSDKPTRGGPGRRKMRGGATTRAAGRLSGVARLRKAAHLAGLSKQTQEVGEALGAISDSYERIPHLEEGSARVPLGEAFDEQMTAMRSMESLVRPDPEDVLEAMLKDIVDSYG